MTKREVANLACRILAIYAWLQFVGSVPFLVEVAGTIAIGPWETDLLLSRFVGALYPILFFFAGMFLWKKSGLIAAWMVGYDIQDHQFEGEAAPKAFDLTDIHSVAFSTLGLFVLIDLIPTVTYYANNFIFARPHVGENESFQSWLFSTAVEIGLRLVIGIWLLFGARGLVYLLRRARGFGVKDT